VRQRRLRPPGTVRRRRPFFIILRSALRRIDPDGYRRLLALRTAADEAFGVLGIGRLQHLVPGREHLLGSAVVLGGRREHAHAFLVMIFVVPAEEFATKARRVFVAAETSRELRAVLHRFEITFRERIVIRDVRPAGVVEKCTYCLHRTRRGRLPACLEACPTGARVFGNILDPNSNIRWILAHKRVYVLKEELGTKPAFFYYFDA
jgi:ferredoxin